MIMEGDAEERVSCTPQTNPQLLGQEEAEEVLLNAWKNNSLHNSWLISGPEGIGKATLAYRFARFLLSADEGKREEYDSLVLPADAPVFRLTANDSHPDLKVLERDFTETDRKKILKALRNGEALPEEEKKNLKKSSFIRVDDVRTINEFLSKRSSNDGWRIVIIDSIDDMNAASANAVLKILEEPPHKALMLLISHNPGRLLPTIKSRCAKLNLHPLSETAVETLLKKFRPGLTDKDVRTLSEISAGSIGKALAYADNDALSVYASLTALADAGKSYRLGELLAFCETAAASEENYYQAQELLLKVIAERIRKERKNPEVLVEIWEKALRLFDEAERLNMDKKQILQNIVYNLCKVS